MKKILAFLIAIVLFFGVIPAFKLWTYFFGMKLISFYIFIFFYVIIVVAITKFIERKGWV